LYRIGFLGRTPSQTWKTLLQALRVLGLAEGRNIVTERRFSEGKQERLPDLAVDLIVTSATPATLAAENATTEVLIVHGRRRRPGGGRTGG
jgi:hypothetical protein